MATVADLYVGPSQPIDNKRRRKKKLLEIAVAQACPPLQPSNTPNSILSSSTPTSGRVRASYFLAMFRQSLRKSVGLARGVLPSSALALGRQSRQLTNRPVRAALLQTATPWKSLPHGARMYSSEATADATANVAENAEPNLETLGFSGLEGSIHPNLLRSITKDMGYDTMTPVQAKTIKPALKGTDM